MLRVVIGVLVLLGGLTLAVLAQNPFDVPISLDQPRETIDAPTPTPPILPSTLPPQTTPRTPASVHAPVVTAPVVVPVPPPTAPPAIQRSEPPVHTSIHTPSASLWQTRPELFRSRPDPEHPLNGLIGPPRTTETLISGTPLPLVTVLQTTRQQPRRLQRIIAYWDCTEALADYHLRCAFERQLEMWSESLRQNGNLAGGDATTMLAILAPTMRLATSERRAAEIRFIRQQRLLADGLDTSDTLPIPCELPLVKAYDTKFDAIAQQRTVSPRARELDAQIPIQHLLIGYHREGAVAAEEVFRAVYEHRGASLMESILALRQVASVRQELVASICSYNKMVAEYVNETVGSEADTYRLLVALIELPPLTE